jgi:hypothetical protein
MDTKDEVTVEQSLELLSDAVGKATEDMRSVQLALDQARTNIATRNTSLPRQVIRDAEKAIDHMRETDECLREVLKDLSERD